MDYKYPTPQLLFKAICNAIRSKTGNSDVIPHQNIPDELDSIITEEEYEIAVQELSNIICGSEVKVLDSKYIPYIAGYKFYGSGLTTVNLPKCTSIGYAAFSGCTNLTTVNLPECTYIDSYAFNGCTNLTTVNLPKCTSTVDNVFHSCTGLTTVNLPECTTLGHDAFNGCTNLTTVNLPKCTSTVDNVFYCCTSLTTINLPECTTLGHDAFISCTNLTTVNLPKCTSIGDNVFRYCTNLTTIILDADQIVSLMGFFTFDNSAISRRTGYIYVPDNLVDSYKSDNNWSTYANQIKPISELPSNLKEEYGYV